MKITKTYEVLEALRGKTIIDEITIDFNGQVDLSRIKKIFNIFDTFKINSNGRSLKICFHQNFLRYVLWDYHSIIQDALKHVENPISIAINVHQLFRNKNERFQLILKEGALTFVGREFIEDTLFLDLQRYCDNSKIKYEVNYVGKKSRSMV